MPPSKSPLWTRAGLMLETWGEHTNPFFLTVAASLASVYFGILWFHAMTTVILAAATHHELSAVAMLSLY